MNRHWYVYSVGLVAALNLITLLLALTLNVETNCNTCSPEGWCTLKGCPLYSDIFADIFTLLLVVSVPLVILLTVIKAVVHHKQN
jgi:hypothetical protein